MAKMFMIYMLLILSQFMVILVVIARLMFSIACSLLIATSSGMSGGQVTMTSHGGVPAGVPSSLQQPHTIATGMPRAAARRATTDGSLPPAVCAS